MWVISRYNRKLNKVEFLHQDENGFYWSESLTSDIKLWYVERVAQIYAEALPNYTKVWSWDRAFNERFKIKQMKGCFPIAQHYEIW